MNRTATLSACGTYRFRLTRTWDDRPRLLVVMFNPSTADHQVDDPTIRLLCHIANHNGFGGIVVCNAIPLRSSKPADAIDMELTWDKRQDWYQRDALQQNLAVVVDEVGKAGAVLLAWGNLGDRVAHWMENVVEEINCALPVGSEIYCLGKTKSGQPKHPLARGKHKVPKDALLLPWSARP